MLGSFEPNGNELAPPLVVYLSKHTSVPYNHYIYELTRIHKGDSPILRIDIEIIMLYESTQDVSFEDLQMKVTPMHHSRLELITKAFVQTSPSTPPYPSLSNHSSST